MIRTGLLLLIANLFAHPSFAKKAFDPNRICADVKCTRPMASILDAYQTSRRPPGAFPLVASGECYLLNNGVGDPGDMHHGMTVMEQIDGHSVYSGAFVLYALTDPVAGARLAEVKEFLQQNTDGQQMPVRILKDRAEVSFSSESDSIRYWFRETRDGGGLILLGLWNSPGFDGETRIFCRYLKHKP